MSAVHGFIHFFVLFFTSVVVLAITAGRLHGGVTAGAPPAQLAHTVPAIVTKSAPTISIAQAGAALCVCLTKLGMGWGEGEKGKRDIGQQEVVSRGCRGATGEGGRL